MKRHSLLFGINNYKTVNGFQPLECPSRDAEALGKLFLDPQFNDAPARVLVRLNRTHYQAQDDLKELLMSPDLNPKEDLVHIHFSGHGFKNDNGNLVLCFTDTVVGELGFNGLSYSFLKERMEDRNLQRALMTLDCCYSGAAIHRDSISTIANSFAKNIPTDGAVAGMRGKGYCIMSACTDHELAREGTQFSIFTHYLLEGIRTGVADREGKGFVTANDLHEFVSRGVSGEALGMRPLIGGKTDGAIFIAVNPEAMARKLKEERLLEVQRFNSWRSDFTKNVRRWLRLQNSNNVFELGFSSQIEDWLSSITPNDRESKLYIALDAALSGAISAQKLYEIWTGENFDASRSKLSTEDEKIVVDTKRKIVSRALTESFCISVISFVLVSYFFSISDRFTFFGADEGSLSSYGFLAGLIGMVLAPTLYYLGVIKFFYEVKCPKILDAQLTRFELFIVLYVANLIAIFLEFTLIFNYASSTFSDYAPGQNGSVQSDDFHYIFWGLASWVSYLLSPLIHYLALRVAVGAIKLSRANK